MHTQTMSTSIRQQLFQFLWKLIYDWAFSLSALIAYYLLISLLPLILSIFAVVSLVFGENPKFQNQIRDRLVKAFPEQGLTDVVDALLNSLTHQAGLVFLISFLIALFTGSRLFIGLDDVLTIIYRIRERTILEQNLLALKMMGAFVLIMPFIIICSSIPALMGREESGYHFLSTLLGTVFTFIFFQIIFYILPKRRMLLTNTYVSLVHWSFDLLSLFSFSFHFNSDGAEHWSLQLVYNVCSCSFLCMFINLWLITLVNWVLLSSHYFSSTHSVSFSSLELKSTHFSLIEFSHFHLA